MKKIFKKHPKRIINKGLIIFLLNMFSIGIGFSTWIIGEPHILQVDFTATVDDVKDVNYFTIKRVTTFALGPDGIEKNNTIVKNGTITAYFIIDNEVAYKVSTSGSISFNAVLSCSDNNFITKYIDKDTNSKPKVVPYFGTSEDVLVKSSVDSSDFNVSNDVTSTMTYTIQETGYTYVSVEYSFTDAVYDMGSSYYSSKPTFTFKVRMA